MSDEQPHGPPEKEVGPDASQDARADQQVSEDTARNADDTQQGDQQPFNVLTGARRRREYAVRLDGGDPDYPGDLRFHQPSTGLRAAGFRHGFACGGTDALRRVWAYIPAEHRGDVVRIAADYGAV